MFNKLGCLIPLVAVLLFFSYVGLKQSFQTLFGDKDWSEDYTQTSGDIIDIEVFEEYDSDSELYLQFVPIVRYVNNQDTLVAEVSWKTWTDNQPAEVEVGQSVAVWINNYSGDVIEPGNTQQTTVGVINFFQGLVLLLLALFLVRRYRRRASSS